MSQHLEVLDFPLHPPIHICLIHLPQVYDLHGNFMPCQGMRCNCVDSRMPIKAKMIRRAGRKRRSLLRFTLPKLPTPSVDPSSYCPILTTLGFGACCPCPPAGTLVPWNPCELVTLVPAAFRLPCCSDGALGLGGIACGRGGSPGRGGAGRIAIFVLLQSPP